MRAHPLALAMALLISWAGARPAAALEPSPAADPPLAVASGMPLPVIRAELEERATPAENEKTSGTHPASGSSGMEGTLSPDRARLMLRSMTVPGWGQLSAGHTTSATVFGVAELGIWTSFSAFRIQSQMRRDTYERTAKLFAGVDLSGRDEEFRRTIGAYISSDEYNQLVVYREAANLYYGDPTNYWNYIAQHSISGRNAWAWADEGALLRYRAQRKSAQRAGIRANTALACAVVNRLFSMLHAARLPAHPASPRSWNLELTPIPGEDALATRLEVRARF